MSLRLSISFQPPRPLTSLFLSSLCSMFSFSSALGDHGKSFTPDMSAIILTLGSAWVVTGEIFPLHTRAKSLAITTATQWLWNWAISFATPYLVDSGPGNAGLGTKVFFVWGTFCIFATAF